MPASPRNILIIKLRHIGDVLLTAPVFRALKAAYPKARVSALVPAGTEEMLTLNPCVDEVIMLRKGGGLVHEAAFVAELRKRRFDLAINMTEGDRGAILALLTGAKTRIGVDPRGRGFAGKKLIFTHLVKPVYDGRHRVALDLDMLAPLGIAVDKPKVEMFVSPDDEVRVEAMLREAGVGDGAPTAVIHPTSRWLFKCWRDEGMAEVADYLASRGITPVITSGPDKREVEKARRIISLAKPGVVDMTGRLRLKELAALMKRSVIFFGVDTAPMHMAAAVGTPVVALFGPSDFRIWGPFSDRARVVAKTEEFPCVPCRKDGCEGSKKTPCLDAITVEDAVKAIDELL